VAGEDGAPLDLRLERGTSLSGTVTDWADGPLPLRWIEVGFVGWGPEHGSRRPYQARLDEQGRFRLRGLPPDVSLEFDELRVVGASGRIRTGPPGSHATVELRRDR